MRRFLALPSSVACPVCDSALVLVREYDRRLALMRHEGRTTCPLYFKSYRVDRLTGDAEEVTNAPQPTEVQVPSHGIAPARTLGQG